MSRFDEFVTLTTTYKTVHDHELAVDMLYPKSLLEPNFSEVGNERMESMFPQVVNMVDYAVCFQTTQLPCTLSNI